MVVSPLFGELGCVFLVIFYGLYYNNKPPFVLELFSTIQQANKISGLTNIFFAKGLLLFLRDSTGQFYSEITYKRP